MQQNWPITYFHFWKQAFCAKCKQYIEKYWKFSFEYVLYKCDWKRVLFVLIEVDFVSFLDAQFFFGCLKAVHSA